jgi:hypothetical protein
VNRGSTVYQEICPSIHRGSVGDSLARTFREKRILYLGSYLGPRGH